MVLHVYVVASVLRQPLPAEFDDIHFATWSLHLDAVRRLGPAADFFALYHAGVQAARGASVYALGEDPQRTPYYYPFRYLPVVAQTLGRALALWPPRTAYHAWVLFLEGLLVTLLVAFWRSLPGERLRVCTSVLLLLATPYFLELHMGQFTFATAALACLGVLFLDSEHQQLRTTRLFLPAFLYTAAVLLKVFPALAIPALLRRRRGWVVSAVALTALVATNLGYFLGNRGSWERFREFTLEAAAGQNGGNHGLVYVFYLAGRDLGVDWTAERFGMFIVAWRLLVLGTLSLLVLVARDSPLKIGAATMLLAQFVTYPQAWEHHSSGVLAIGLLLVCGLANRNGRQRGRHALLGLAVAALFLLALPTPFYILGPRPSLWPAYGRYLLPLSKAVPTLLLLSVGGMAIAGSGLSLRPWRLSKEAPR